MDIDTDIELTRRNAAIAVVAFVVVLLLVTGAVAATYDRPVVEQVQTEFGEVGEDRSEIRTSVVVQNPNSRPLPVGVDITYTVTLNDIRVARGAERGVRIAPGRNTVRTTADFDNTRIPEWWVTHVNAGERSTLRTTARVDVVGPFGTTIPATDREITTDFLGPLAADEPSTLGLGDTELLAVSDQQAAWGTADAERTPIEFSTALENRHDRPVRLDGTDYVVRMNGIVVGEGRSDDGIVLDPGEAGTLTVEAAIETPLMQEWWVSHLRADESTELVVEVFAVVERDGQRQRLPLTVFERQAAFDTDFLGTGATEVTVLEGETDPAFEQPGLEESESDWGEVRDDETDIRTTVDIRNDNDEAFTDVLRVALEQETTIAGVTVAEGTDTIAEIPPGTSSHVVTTTKQHSTVPEWWAAHLRNGEVSEARTETDAEADVGVTTLPVEVDDRESTVETDLLGGLNDDSTRSEAPLRIHSTSAEWVDPTPEEATIRVTADVENTDLFASVTLRDIDYVVDINDVRLADDTAPESHTFAPGERKTVEFTFVLDNSKMEAWWPTHIRRGERSEVDRQVTATVEVGGNEERRELGFLSDTVEVETDLLSAA